MAHVPARRADVYVQEDPNGRSFALRQGAMNIATGDAAWVC